MEILDYASAASLRAKYENHSNVNISLIEEVDYISDGGYDLVELPIRRCEPVYFRWTTLVRIWPIHSQLVT